MTYEEWYRITKNCLYCRKEYSKMGKICYQMDHSFVALPSHAHLWFHDYERGDLKIDFHIDPYECYCKILNQKTNKTIKRKLNNFNKEYIDNIVKNIEYTYRLMG